MSQHTAVITGASKGIGADLAAKLIERGYTVINPKTLPACRNCIWGLH